MVSTVPPTACGIATFAAALSAGLRNAGAVVFNVESGQQSSGRPGSDPVASLGSGSRREVLRAAAALSQSDVVVVQHEYGIYPGQDGRCVVDLVEAIEVPVTVVAHTVLSAPSSHQRDVLVALCARADAVVAMTDVARNRLIDLYGVDPRAVHVIPHGAGLGGVGRSHSGDRRRMLTWGLLGPGKGIEWAIDAFATIADGLGDVDYLVAGATHPKVLSREGESYRNSLDERVAQHGLAGRVRFDDAYRDVPALCELISTADVVVLPYDSVDQVTSGVLVDAVAAGRPVISTAFPHARELLASGAGLTVPQRDPSALADAMFAVLGEPGRSEIMGAEARRIAPELSWDAIARRYVTLLESSRSSVRSIAS